MKRNLDIYHKDKPSKVILNGGDKEIFKNHYNNYWNDQMPLKIVTHHWSANKMKGWDVYKRLDDLVSHATWKNIIEFTYIGNIPKGFAFKNTKYLRPMNGEKLGRELSRHHVYLSASINEPAGMHHIEGILCGLPIIYRNSGALPEYCNNFGIQFENKEFLPALKRIMDEYPRYKKNITKYPHNSERMTSEYLQLFSKLYSDRKQILKKRSLLKSPIFLLLNIIFWILKLKNRLVLINKMQLKKS